MKRYIKNTLAALSIVALASSCGDFGDLNVDPEHSNSSVLTGTYGVTD